MLHILRFDEHKICQILRLVVEGENCQNAAAGRPSLSERLLVITVNYY